MHAIADRNQFVDGEPGSHTHAAVTRRSGQVLAGNPNFDLREQLRVITCCQLIAAAVVTGELDGGASVKVDVAQRNMPVIDDDLAGLRHRNYPDNDGNDDAKVDACLGTGHAHLAIGEAVHGCCHDGGTQHQ